MDEVGLRRGLKASRRSLWDARAPLADHPLRSIVTIGSAASRPVGMLDQRPLRGKDRATVT